MLRCGCHWSVGWIPYCSCTVTCFLSACKGTHDRTSRTHNMWRVLLVPFDLQTSYVFTHLELYFSIFLLVDCMKKYWIQPIYRWQFNLSIMHISYAYLWNNEFLLYSLCFVLYTLYFPWDSGTCTHLPIKHTVSGSDHQWNAILMAFFWWSEHETNTQFYVLTGSQIRFKWH